MARKAPVRAENLDEVEEGTGIAFEVYHPVDLAKLNDEITTAHNWRNSAELSARGNLANASASDPVTVFVAREDADTDTVLATIADHKP